jgi:LmbE family N-acetylglucosaminyl deacetylase
MRAGDVFVALEAAPVVPLDALVGAGGVVVVAPHPDDESLGCGGLIAAACREGRSTQLVIVSDGCGSHAGSRLFPPVRLRALREAETLEAAGILGLSPEQIRFLRLPDAAVPKDGSEADAAADAIAAAAHEAGASAIFVTWRHDPHCDHEAAAAIVDRVRARLSGIRIVAYPVWGWTLPPGTDVGSPGEFLRLDVSDDRETKRRAVAAHRSQTTDLIGDDPTGFRRRTT